MQSVNRELHHPTTNSTNFILVKDDDVGDVLFGCPPEVVKYFNSKNEPIPSNIVIPQRTFRKGKNYFDLEFVAYSIIFSQRTHKTINIVCTLSQELRIKIVLQEALFGPVFKDVFKAFLFDGLLEFSFDEDQISLLEYFVQNVGDDETVFDDLKKIVTQKTENEVLLLKMEARLKPFLSDLQWLNEISQDLESIITKAYVKSAKLKLEMSVFAICPEKDNNKFINDFIRFNYFNSEGNAKLTGENGRQLVINQNKNGIFELYKNGNLIDSFNLELHNLDNTTMQIAALPIEQPELGITFLGSGTGFDPETCTSCYIIWINGKAIAVDLLANCEEHFRRMGIASSDITHIFLSHLHADHDAGILEKIMLGEKSYFLTSNLIFESFLRKAEALTKFSQESLKEFVDFINVEQNKEIPVPGIDGAYILFDYAFHSIPTGRFKLRYKARDGSVYKIGFSGDTKYDKKFVNKMHQDGLITTERRDAILGFLWDCNLIIYEAGGGVLHTNIEDLMELPKKIRKKIILTHTDHKLRVSKEFDFAREGRTITIIQEKHPLGLKNIISIIKRTGFFPKFTFEKLEQFLEHCVVEVVPAGTFIFKQDEHGDKFYIILSGFAEIIKDGKVLSIYEKGRFFGELVLINKNRKRVISIKAKSKLRLLVIERSTYNKYNLSSVIHERLYELSNYFTDTPHSSLIGFISQGEFVKFKKGENIITIGDVEQEVYILLTGEVSIINSENIQIDHVKNVEVLGEIAFLKQIPRTATIRVVSEEATTIRLRSELFNEIYRKFPFFYATILKKMDRRFNVG